ncbi:hypothetical protein ACFRAR_11085 [Kitasatospora sp. NPDC056651]|uniref:hypothetical protein n=1 Tax=Kitasatospora sp. NPDC056651 TaxID=3345892 RepID=UPI0036973E6D
MHLINHRSDRAAAQAFVELLGWQVKVGHRCRTWQGCTCENPECPVPGAHPVADGSPLLRDAEAVCAALEASPGGALIAPTTAFDAVVVPRDLGSATLAALDAKSRQVPCILTGSTATFLVEAGTGQEAFQGEETPGEVRGGGEGWVALPPSTGCRWDTFPWLDGTVTPRALRPGGDLAGPIADSLLYYRSRLAARTVEVGAEAVA